ncbi:MAG: hypothetical protein ACI4BA_03310 [Prevotella sp.]
MRAFLHRLMFAFLVALGFSSQAMAETVVYGCGSGALNWNMVSFDLDAINTQSSVKPTTLFSMPEVESEVLCGASVGKKYFAYYLDENTGDMLFSSMNFTTGKVVQVCSYGGVEWTMRDLEYDAATGKLYGVMFVKQFDEEGRMIKIARLVEINPANGELTSMAEYEGVTPLALALNPEGGFYLVAEKISSSFKYVPVVYSIAGDAALTLSQLFMAEDVSYNGSVSHSCFMYGGSLYFFSGGQCFTFDVAAQKGALKGSLSGNFSGLSFEASTEDGTPAGTTVTGNRVLVSRTYYGDAMGTAPLTQDMTRKEYYYNTNGKLQMMVELGRGLQTDAQGKVTGYGDYEETSYTVNDFDANGNMITASKYQYGLYDFGEMGRRFNYQNTYTYDLNGNLIEQVESGYRTVYEYKDGNMTKQMVYSSTDDLIQQMVYSNFREDHQPQKVVSTSPNHPEWTSYIYTETRTYDENGMLILAQRKDGQNNLLQEETWTYEEDFLKEYVRAYAFDLSGQMVAAFKTSYAMVDGNPDVVGQVDSTYVSGKWYMESGTKCICEYQDFSDKKGSCQIAEFVVLPAQDARNTAVLQFSVPDMAYATDCMIRILRNGKEVAVKNAVDLLPEDGEGGFGLPLLQYTDSALVNGDYLYMLQVCGVAYDAESNATPVGYYVSGGADITFNLELPKVTDVKLISARKSSSDYYGTVGWENPADMEEYGFISNDLYLDKNQLAETSTTDANITALEGNFYYTSHKAYILSRYKYGKVCSDTITVTRTNLKDIIAGIETVDANGKTISFDGKSLQLQSHANVSVYTGSGMLATRQRNANHVDMSTLSAGVYVVSVERNGITSVYKLTVQ